MPLDNETQQHRGFAFIEFELPEDAASAKENMDDSELFGRRLRVAYTRPSSVGAGKPCKTILCTSFTCIFVLLLFF